MADTASDKTLDQDDDVEMEPQINEGDDEDDTSSDNDSGEDEKDAEKESKVSALAKEISQNPYMYDLHPQRIKLLREMGELERLRAAREEMSLHFPLTEELWLQWMEDEIPLASNMEEKEKVLGLFDRAFQDYQSVPVWLEFVQFAIGRLGEEDGVTKVRESFERAVNSVGLHVAQGSNIWEAYREFEHAMLSGLLPQPGSVPTKEQEEAFTIQNQKVDSLFKRQLAVPLNNMDKTVQEYLEWKGEDSLDPKIRASHEKATEIYKLLQPFEDQMLTSEPPHLEVYLEYIKHELKSDDPARIQCIYERALSENCLVPDLWLQYTKYLDKLKVKQQIVSTYNRAIRNCPWTSQLWVNYLLAKERQDASFEDMKSLVDKALTAGFVNASDYLNVWMHYCDYLRRRIDWDSDHKEQLETFRLTIETAIDFMLDNYGAEGDPEGTLNQFWAFIEAKHCKNLEKAREIWTQLMQAGHGPEAGMWLQYYRLERAYGDNKHCRRILQKALNSVTDWPESIVQAYINFEREEGDLGQFDTAMSKCEAQMERISDRRAKAAEKEAAQQETKKGGKAQQDPKKQDWKKQGKKDGKNFQKNETSRSEESSSPHKGYANVSPSHGNKRKFEPNEKDSDGFAKPTAPGSVEPPEKKRKQDDPTATTGHGESVTHDSTKDNITVFVSNLDFGLEVDRLKEIFKPCGEINEVRLVRNYKGKSKGYGYVEFKDGNTVLKALRMDRELVDGRPMFVSRCEDRSAGKTTQQFKYATNMEKNKLFVRGLPFTVTKEAMENIFGEHGKVKEIRMVTYRNGSPKGIAYVEYETGAMATQAVLKTDGLKVGEYVISVAISNPPERKTPMSTRMDPPRMASLGGGKRETETRGKVRTQVSLVPRSVRQGPSTSSSSSSSTSSSSKPSSGVSDAGDVPNGNKSGGAMSNEDFRKMLLK